MTVNMNTTENNNNITCFDYLFVRQDISKHDFCLFIFSCLPFDPGQASLTYAEAQMRIDDTTRTDDITKSLRGLNKLAKILKKQRIKNG